MKSRQITGVLPNQLNTKRKHEILMNRANAESKLEKHVMSTYVTDTKRNPHPLAGCPDGGTRSALIGVGGVCLKCGSTRDDILETKEGAVCDAAAYRKFSAPLDLTGTSIDGRTGRGGQPVNLAHTPTAGTRVDPLADVFAA